MMSPSVLHGCFRHKHLRLPNFFQNPHLSFTQTLFFAVCVNFHVHFNNDFKIVSHFFIVFTGKAVAFLFEFCTY